MVVLTLDSGLIGLCLIVVATGHWRGFPFWVFRMAIQMSVAAMALDATAGIRKNAVAALGKAASPRMAGAFAVCLNDKDDTIRMAASNALKELLPKLQASDRQYFAPIEMDGLLKALGGKDGALTLAILKALQQIGDDHAVSRVEELISKSKSTAVRNAAEECLPFLQARAEETRQARTLLRASHTEAVVAVDMLLRPAAGTQAETAPEELLRANAQRP
jgi:hypothetical protein